MVKLRCGNCNIIGNPEVINTFARYKCLSCGAVNEVLNIPLKSWLGFNYEKYLKEILAFIREYDFPELAGLTRTDVMRGKFSSTQINKLKSVLERNFKEGNSIRDIFEDVIRDVKVKDLKLYNESGELTRTYPKLQRGISIARTETTRAANAGSLRQYNDAGVEFYRWVATPDDRICEICARLNNNIFEVNNGPQPPIHSLCRCSTNAVIVTAKNEI